MKYCDNKDINQPSVLVLADIDDHFCHTVKKFRAYVGDEARFGEACVIDQTGKALSYRSAKQKAYLEWLTRGARIVPITGRSSEKFKQVKLGFDGYAIVSFGGIILTPEGTPEPTWFEHIRRQSAAQSANLQMLYQAVASRQISNGIVPAIVSDFGLDLFLKVQSKDNNQDELDATAAIIREHLPEDWTVHLNENQLGAYPSCLDKKLAAEYFLANLAGNCDLVLGAGDSSTDTGFMSVCDFMLAPIGSQIFKNLLAVSQ